MPVYNVAPYLRRCIDSLLAQTFRDFEIILVDDGSTDGSSDICEEYAKINDKENKEYKVRIKVRAVHQPNAGVSSARNRGVDEARGVYISFIDADDWVEPDFLQAFADETAQHEDVDLVVQAFFDRDEKVIAAPPNTCKTREEIDSLLFELDEHRQIGYVWNKLFKRQVAIDSHLLFDTSLPIGEDAIFCLAFVLQCNSLAVSDYAGYHYNIPALTREYPYQPFNAWERRLDAFEELAQRHTGRHVIQQFRAREFQLALYVLGIAYYVKLDRQKRTEFIRKIRLRGNLCKHQIRHQQGLSTLGFLVLYVPPTITEMILSIRRQFRKHL